MLFCIVTFNLWLHYNKLLTYLYLPSVSKVIQTPEHHPLYCHTCLLYICHQSARLGDCVNHTFRLCYLPDFMFFPIFWHFCSCFYVTMVTAGKVSCMIVMLFVTVCTNITGKQLHEAFRIEACLGSGITTLNLPCGKSCIVAQDEVHCAWQCLFYLFSLL